MKYKNVQNLDKVYNSEKEVIQEIEENVKRYQKKHLNGNPHCYIDLGNNSKKMVSLDYEDKNKKYLFLNHVTGEEIECDNYSNYQRKYLDYFNKETEIYKSKVVSFYLKETKLEDDSYAWVPYNV